MRGLHLDGRVDCGGWDRRNLTEEVVVKTQKRKKWDVARQRLRTSF